MPKKKNTGKVALSIFLGVCSVAAIVGTAFAISRAVNKETVTSSPTVISTSGNSGSNNSGSSGSGTGSGSGSGQQGGNQSGQEEGGTNEEGNNSGQEHSEQIAINCLAGEVYWNSTVQQGEMNELTFTATLTGLPSDATDEDKGLYIYCDDDDLGEWIKIYRVVNGVEQEMNSPFHFQSGEQIHLKQKKLANVGTFYKIPLWIFSDTFDTDEVYHIIDVWMRTNA